MTSEGVWLIKNKSVSKEGISSGFNPGLVSCLVTAVVSVRWEPNKESSVEKLKCFGLSVQLRPAWPCASNSGGTLLVWGSYRACSCCMFPENTEGKEVLGRDPKQGCCQGSAQFQSASTQIFQTDWFSNWDGSTPAPGQRQWDTWHLHV